MKINAIGGAALGMALLASALFPRAALSAIAAITIFSAIAMSGAWLIDRFGSLPGDRSRAA